ncbi:DUF2730 family protein [Ochrobactrum sp. MR28]|nr:DUF2730 family protein [Ochrobactrum sp. MR28]MBX8814761.1 DUF2730 family protein [Ochrobactrum sp. MR31]
MQFQDISAYLSPIALMISVGATIWTVLTSGSKKNAEELGEVKTELAQQERRIQRIEDELKHLPDKNTTHRLEIALEKMSGRLSSMDERLKPIAAISERMQELLISQGMK